MIIRKKTVILRKQLGIGLMDWKRIKEAAGQVGITPAEWVGATAVGKARFCVQHPNHQPRIKVEVHK